MPPLLRNSLSGRIVNVSSGLGSLIHNGNPSWEFAQAKFLGYNSSKAALNMLTVQLAGELKNTRIKVNSADPGFTARDPNNHRGHRSIPEGAAAVDHLALLPDDGPTGGFFSKRPPAVVRFRSSLPDRKTLSSVCSGPKFRIVFGFADKPEVNGYMGISTN
jgi:NAD(P)-dependent dehydrogenase (short-subunit alcohol dehydrogenase family)